MFTYTEVYVQAVRMEDGGFAQSARPEPLACDTLARCQGNAGPTQKFHCLTSHASHLVVSNLEAGFASLCIACSVFNENGTLLFRGWHWGGTVAFSIPKTLDSHTIIQNVFLLTAWWHLLFVAQVVCLYTVFTVRYSICILENVRDNSQGPGVTKGLCPTC